MMISDIVYEDVLQIISENGGLCELFGKSVLITGASGMIGSYIVYTLMVLNEDFGANIRIVPLVRDLYKLSDEVVCKEYICPVVQDVTDEIRCDFDVDYVIHCASPSSPHIIEKMPVETNFANTLGTANTLIFAKENGCECYLFVSSREVYGDPIDDIKYFSEDDKGYVDHLMVRNCYGEGKKAGENMCVAFMEEYGLNVKIVRLTHIYGPGMSMDDGRVQSDFLKNFINDEDIVLKSDGSSVRIYLYVSDAVSAIFKVLLKSRDVVYNISDIRNEISIKELAKTIIEMYPEKLLDLKFETKDHQRKENLKYAPFKSGVLSCEKLTNELGWSAKYSVSEGFRRTIDFLKKDD